MNEKKTTPTIRRHRLFPRALGDCVDKVTKPVFQKHGIAETRLIRDWERIVGPLVARSAWPHSLTFTKGKSDGGTLTILVTPAFALELQYMETALLERIAAYFGFRAVSRITLRQWQPPQEKNAPAKVEKKTANTPFTLPVSIEDPELEAALTALGQRLQNQPD